MARVRLTGVRWAHNVDVPQAGVVRLDVALQFVQKRAMRLGRIGEGLRPACFCHAKNYAVALVVSHPMLMACKRIHGTQAATLAVKKMRIQAGVSVLEYSLKSRVTWPPEAAFRRAK